MAYVGNADYVLALRGSSVRLSSSTGTVVTSDIRKKYDIEELDDRFLNVIMDLNPVIFKMIDDESKKINIGFIAQDVENTFNKYNLNIDDFSILNKFEDDGETYYGLIYEYFIAINTYAIQKSLKEINSIKISLEKIKRKINLAL